MCMKTPKAPKAPAEKKPIYMSNAYLDGLAIGGGRGRNSLRIDLATPGAGVGAPQIPTGWVPRPMIPTIPQSTRAYNANTRFSGNFARTQIA